MKNTKYKLFLLVSKYMPVVIAIGIFINIILAIVYKPLLMQNNGQPVDYATAIDNQIAQMQSIKQQLVDNRLQPPQNVVNQQLKQITLFDEINNEVSALTNSQKEILFKDKEYAQNEYEIQTLVQEELINLVKAKLQAKPRGKELLDKQLKLVRDKKKEIVEESNREMELFKKFQIAAQANPDLSYAEFIKQFNKQ